MRTLLPLPRNGLGTLVRTLPNRLQTLICRECGRRFLAYKARFCGDVCRKRHARAHPAAHEPNPARSNARPWSPWEDRTLTLLLAEGRPRREIAEALERSKDSIDARIERNKLATYTDRFCKCGKKLARMNMNDRCFACIEADKNGHK